MKKFFALFMMLFACTSIFAIDLDGYTITRNGQTIDFHANGLAVYHAKGMPK